MITQENIPYTADEIKAMVKTCEKYNKVRDMAKKIYNSEFKPDEAAVLSKYLSMLFPELKESKDERIRKTIYGWIYTQPSEFFDDSFSKEEMLDWVEKQDQKETTWSEEDEENMNNVFYILYQLKDTSSYEEDNIAEKTINWLKSLKDRLCSNSEYDKDMLGAIEYCKKNNRPLEKEHLAWLEKQGKAYRINNTPNCGISVNIYNDNEECKESKDERMEFEPKFKVGNWITDGYIYYKITEILDDRYIIESKYDKRGAILFEYENRYHLWTIQDAKDGDVLVNWNNTTFIFKAIEDETVKYHVAYNEEWDTIKTASTKLSHLGLSKPQFEFHPATKEQCELLFSKMKEAGCEWDSKKKELKKIEVTSKKSKDERMKKQLSEYLHDNMHYKDAQEITSWLEKLIEKQKD